MPEDCLDFMEKFENPQKELMIFLHHFLCAQTNVRAKMTYKIPFYYKKTWICYLNPTKDNRVELGFTRGNELSNEQGLLESKGRKQVWSVTWATLDEINKKTLHEVIQEALLLDDEVPYRIERLKK